MRKDLEISILIVQGVDHEVHVTTILILKLLLYHLQMKICRHILPSFGFSKLFKQKQEAAEPVVFTSAQCELFTT